MPKYAGALLRTFICVSLPQSRVDALSAAIAQLRRGAPGIRWAAPQTIHITLKFCGELPQDVVNGISNQLSAAELGCPFELSAEGLGGFPKLAAPRVLWTGLAGDVSALFALQKRAELCAFRAGVPKEQRRFSPHITLGRRNETAPFPTEALKALEAVKIELPSWKVSEIIYMRSELTPRGPIYTPIKKFPLAE